MTLSSVIPFAAVCHRRSDSRRPGVAAWPSSRYPRHRFEAHGQSRVATCHQQSQLQAQKQEVSKQIKEKLAEGQRLATFLRAGLKQHYSHSSENLVEFGLQPLRKRSRGSKAEPEVETSVDSES